MGRLSPRQTGADRQRPAGKHMAGRWEFPGGKVTAAKPSPRLWYASYAKNSA